jgi:hypothetical protein
MKRFGFTLVCLTVSLVAALAQNGKFSFNETVHDFGVIGDKDGKVSCEFIITNHSDSPLLITDVKPSCGCTTSGWTKEPIESGETGKITAVYSPSGSAPFSKTLAVYTNQSNPVTLRIKGEVIAGTINSGNRLPSKDYTVEFGDYLLKTQSVDFGKIGPDEIKTIQLDVYNRSDKPLSQKTLKLPKYITVVFDSLAVAPKEEAKITLNFNAESANQYGYVKGVFSLLIDGKPYSISYSSVILDNFAKWSSEKKANAGKINVNFPEVNFGNLSKGNSRIIKVANSGKSDLNIRNIQIYDPSISVSKTKFSVTPGAMSELKITVDGKKIGTGLNAKILLITDDPRFPVYEVTIIVNP